MINRRLLFSISLLSCLPAYAEPVVTDEQLAAVKSMTFRVFDVNSWKKPGASETPLDLILVASKKDGAIRKTIDGKLEIEARHGQLTVNIQSDNPSFYMPVTWPKGGSSGVDQRSGIDPEVLQGVNGALNNVGAPCTLRESEKQSELHCMASPFAFLNTMADIEVDECPKDKSRACVDVDGHQIVIRQAAKRSFKVAAPQPVMSVLRALIEDAFRKGIWAARDQTGSKVALPALTFSFNDNGAPVHAIPRAQYDKISFKERENLHQLGTIAAAEVKEEYARILTEKKFGKMSEIKDLQARQKIAMKTATSFSTMPNNQVTLAAIKFYGYESHAVCTIGNKTGDAAEKARLAVLGSESFRKWMEIDISKRFRDTKPDLDALYSAMQQKHCTAVIDTAENVAKLAVAINKDREAISVFEKTFDAAFFAQVEAEKAGFYSDADRKFAEKMGVKSQIGVNRLRETGLIDDSAVQKAQARMRASGYAGGAGNVLQFRYDEIEAVREKTTAKAIYDARVAAAVAAQGIYAGLSDEKAAYKALTRIYTIREPEERRHQVENCTKLIGYAESEKVAVSRENGWQVARRYCIEGAPR